MSDLSWLNPTPHAIAVYASQPPSPMDLRNTRYQADATPYLSRTCTGWIAPAFAWRTHSMISSARAIRLGDTVRPSAFAVLRFIASSYLVGACTGWSAGFSPLR